jgi:hypothetical protein
LIFAGLVALILIPLAWIQLREVFRPKLVGARIVTATDHDPVFRDGPRHVPPGHDVDVAVALELERAWRGTGWLAPVERLEIDGTAVDHVEATEWPVDGRELRVFWFTVESTNIGGELGSESAGRLLRYRNSLAPEMGRGLRAAAYPEAHNDDALGPPPETTPDGTGTLRFYARVEVFDPEHPVRPLQAISSESVDGLPDPRFPAVHRSIEGLEGIHPTVGELFLLPGFEPVTDPPGAWNEITRPAFGLPFTDLVERRLVVSSRTFALVAITGSPLLDDDRLDSLGRADYFGGEISRRGVSLRWRTDVLPGDMLIEGGHWMVLAGDDGNGVLDGGDEILHCWRRPPGRTTLSETLDDGAKDLELYRYEH